MTDFNTCFNEYKNENSNNLDNYINHFKQWIKDIENPKYVDVGDSYNCSKYNGWIQLTYFSTKPPNPCIFFEKYYGQKVEFHSGSYAYDYDDAGLYLTCIRFSPKKDIKTNRLKVLNPMSLFDEIFDEYKHKQQEEFLKEFNKKMDETSECFQQWIKDIENPKHMNIDVNKFSYGNFSGYKYNGWIKLTYFLHKIKTPPNVKDFFENYFGKKVEFFQGSYDYGDGIGDCLRFACMRFLEDEKLDKDKTKDELIDENKKLREELEKLKR